MPFALSIAHDMGHTRGVARDSRDVERIAQLEAEVADLRARLLAERGRARDASSRRKDRRLQLLICSMVHSPDHRISLIAQALGCLAITGLASTILAGCGPSMSEAARAIYVKDWGGEGCKATVRERSDLNSSPRSHEVYEVTGCSADVIYMCTPGQMHSDTVYDTTYVGWVKAECSSTGWCTPDGCDSVNLAVRKTFAKDQACPVNRVTATPAKSVQPAWHTYMTASGCGSETAYDCEKPRGTRSIPVCDSIGIAARNAFAKEQTCPANRVTTAPYAPVIATPPSDIAADPERMRIWADTHRAQIAGHAFMSAAGCGSETVYDCNKPPGTTATLCTSAESAVSK